MEKLQFTKGGGKDLLFHRGCDVKDKTAICDKCYDQVTSNIIRALALDKGAKFSVDIPEVARQCWKYYLVNPNDTSVPIMQAILESGQEDLLPGEDIYGKISGCMVAPAIIYKRDRNSDEAIKRWANKHGLDMIVFNGCPAVFRPMVGDYGSLPKSAQISENEARKAMGITNPSIATAFS